MHTVHLGRRLILSLLACCLFHALPRIDRPARAEGVASPPYMLEMKDRETIPFWFAMRAEPGEIGRPVERLVLGFRGTAFTRPDIVAIRERELRRVVETASDKKIDAEDLVPSPGAFDAIAAMEPMLISSTEHQGQSILALGSNLRTDVAPPQIDDWLTGQTLALFPQDVFAAYRLQGLEFRRVDLTEVFDPAMPMVMGPQPASAPHHSRRGDLILGIGVGTAGFLGSMAIDADDPEPLLRAAWLSLALSGLFGIVNAVGR